MAVPDDSQIEQCLRRVVREAEKKGEDVTVKRARERTEAQLKLETGFLRRENWKQRSKDIIESAFQGEEEHESPRKQRPASAKEPNQDQSKRQNGTGKKSSEVAQEDDASSTKEKSASKSKSRSNGDEQRVGGESGHIESQKDIAPRKPEKTVPKVNGVKRKSETESSSEGESGESEEESAGKHSGPQRKKAKVDPSATSEESSGESSSGGSESSKDEEAEKDSPQSTESQTTTPPPKPREEAVTAIPPKPFKPPSGHTPLDPNLLANNIAFSQSNLDGKQVWHITAPSNIPLSSLNDFTLDAIPSATPVLTHNNISYILHESPQGADTSNLFLPTRGTYQCLPNKVERTLHLQQKITLPDLNLSRRQASQTTGSRAAGDVAQAPVSSVRPQPKGLQMRYRPPGSGKGGPGWIGSGSESADEDEEEEEGSSRREEFQFPKTLGAFESSARRDGGSGQSAEMTEYTGKGKKRRREERRENGSDELVNGTDEPAPPDEAKRASSAKSAAKEQLAEALANATAHEGESKEERRKRKEEKRLRKEAKRAS